MKIIIIFFCIINLVYGADLPQTSSLSTKNVSFIEVSYKDSIIISTLKNDTTIKIMTKINSSSSKIMPMFFLDSIESSHEEIILKEVSNIVFPKALSDSILAVSKFSGNLFVLSVDLRKEQKIEKNFEDYENYDDDLIIDVIGHKGKKVGGTVLTKEKIDKTAGYLHETIKTVEMTKSASRGISEDWRDDPIRFRGAGAFDTKYYLDGIEMDKYYHWGGWTSAIPSDVITKMDIVPSIAMSTVGNGTGGTINLVTADTVANHFSLGFGLQGTDIYGYTNIPIAKEKASIYLYARRCLIFSYIPFADYVVNKGKVQWNGDGMGDKIERGDDRYTDIFSMINAKFSKNSSSKLFYSYSYDIFEDFGYRPKKLVELEGKLPPPQETKYDENGVPYTDPISDSLQVYITSIYEEINEVKNSLPSTLPRDELEKINHDYDEHEQHLLLLSHKLKLNDLKLMATVSGQYTKQNRSEDIYSLLETAEATSYYNKKAIEATVNSNYQTKFFNHFLSLNGKISNANDFDDKVIINFAGDTLLNCFGSGRFPNSGSNITKGMPYLGSSTKKSLSLVYAPSLYLKNFEIIPQIRLNAVDESVSDESVPDASVSDSLYLFPEFRGQVVYNLPNKASVYVSGGQAKRVEDPHLYYKTGMVSSNQITVGIEELKFHKTDISFAGFYHQYKGVPEFRDTTLTYSGEDYTNLGIDSESYTYNIIDPFATETRSAGVELGLSTNLKKMFFDINSAYKHTYTYSNKYKKWLPDAIDERFNLKIMTNYQFNNRHSVSLSYLFTTGKPDYESLGSIFNSATANGVRMYEPDTLGLRLPNYHSLSVAYIYNLANLIKRRNFGFELSVRHLNALFAPQVEEGGVEQVPVVQLRLAWNFGVDE